jgi:hypothetical protein
VPKATAVPKRVAPVARRNDAEPAVKEVAPVAKVKRKAATAVVPPEQSTDKLGNDPIQRADPSAAPVAEASSPPRTRTAAVNTGADEVQPRATVTSKRVAPVARTNDGEPVVKETAPIARVKNKTATAVLPAEQSPTEVTPVEKKQKKEIVDRAAETERVEPVARVERDNAEPDDVRTIKRVNRERRARTAGSVSSAQRGGYVGPQTAEADSARSSAPPAEVAARPSRTATVTRTVIVPPQDAPLDTPHEDRQGFFHRLFHKDHPDE